MDDGGVYWALDVYTRDHRETSSRPVRVIRYDGCRFCVGDRYYLLGVRILCEADYEEHLRQFDDQLQLCNGDHLQPVSMATHDNNQMTTSTSDATSWCQPSQQQLVLGRRFHSSTKNHKFFDDRSSGYGSPSPPCV